MNPSSSSSGVSLALLADSPPRMMDGAAMDYFLMELVQTVRHSSKVATTRVKKVEREMIEAGLLPTPPPVPPTLKKKDLQQRDSMQRDSMGSGSGSSLANVNTGKGPADEEEEEVRTRLEAIGLHVGANIAERLCHDRPGFSNTLDTIKFICKDLWSTCWDKQVDNLRTNHRGVYVLQDNTFKPIVRLSSWDGRADAARRAKLYVAMPAGIIRGTLLRLGIQAVIIPEINLPQCTFQVKLPKGTWAPPPMAFNG